VGEINLRVDVVSPTDAGDGTDDGGGMAAADGSHEEGILAVMVSFA
jgi:hypothetical protein